MFFSGRVGFESDAPAEISPLADCVSKLPVGSACIRRGWWRPNGEVSVIADIDGSWPVVQ
jgi:hypothetical protein